ncbi:gluconokinase [Brevibacillus ruminantium]|uniref:Gluconokinase n=1 Tax=Brevibacillus ruminantium TaxID=2950604 RepID=A0ABY4WDV7_9BACL|nr:gluconokinase [Brevibacillus ruminantium]USG65352.1 gluconokinase [Brevibacillus ruminantium]
MRHDVKTTCVIGLDIGTTSTKAVVYREDGQLLGLGNVNYDLSTPRPAWAEQDPDEIFAAVLTALREAISHAGVEAGQIAAIGFSTAMHSLIAVDESGRPLTNLITWADNRSLEQTERLKREGLGKAIYQHTGTPIHPMSPLSKLIWMKEEDPETFQRAAKFISIKEYVLYKLFGEYVVDYSIASATGLFDIRRLDWYEPALEAAGITRDRLSLPVPTTHILRGIRSPYSTDIGISPETPFVVGASDGVLANLGVGAIRNGQLAVTIGTSGAVRSVVDRPLTDEQGRTFCYVLAENRWVIGGPTNNGGIALRWFRDQFGEKEGREAKERGLEAYDLMLEAASQVPAGAEGLLFLPYLSGERAPHWNAEARGSFFGIGLHHRREHFMRAVLEGILFSVYHVETVLRQLAGRSEEILASGGFARSAVWRQMMSDLFGYDLLVPQTHESSSFGAAVLAMQAVGMIGQLEEVERLVSIVERHQPNVANTAVYHQLFTMYEKLYEKNMDLFSQLASFQRQ